MDNLTLRLAVAQVASCTCGTKTPDIEYHDPMCHYRLFQESEKEIEILRKALGIK